MRGTRSRGQGRPIIEGLQMIADFLNSVGSDTTEEEWMRACPVLQRKVGQMTIATATDTGLSREVLWATLAEARNLRWWLNNDLCFARGVGLEKNPFQALVYRLNECKFEMGWQCDPVAKGVQPFHSQQAVVAIRQDKQTLGRWAAVSWPITRTMKEWCYAILGKALETGDILRLKTCRQCAKYFVVVKDAKLVFCAPACKRTYHQQDRAMTGYYQDRRRRKRKQDLATARGIVKSVKDQGKTGRAIREKIREQIRLKCPKLPARVIDEELAAL